METAWIPRLIGLGCLSVFVLVFAAGGIYLIYRAVKSTQESKASQSWPSTVGRVVEARLRESTSTDSDGDFETRYSPHIKYGYDVGGHSYVGERLVFGPIATSPRPNKIQAVLDRYPPGTQVTVYYNPENPIDAVLERRAGATSASVIIGIALLCVSACLCFPGVGSILLSSDLAHKNCEIGGIHMSTRNPFQEVEQQIVGDVYTSREAMDNLIVLCDDFGSRFGGTEGERRAAEFMKARLEAYGLRNVHLEPVEYVGWTRGAARLEMVHPIQRSVPCISLPHSPPADLEGLIVDMEDGIPEDFDRRADEISGKIAMTTSVTSPGGASRWVHRMEKYGRSVLAGAVGFVFVNHYPAYGPATGGIGYRGEGHIPGISICKEDGALLQRLVKRYGEVRVRLATTDHSEPMTSWNVVGDLPGSRDADQVVMVGCHYDGHDISQGAEDPASGTVAVLEAARVLSKYAAPMPCTVRFALWGIEEIGLLGSRAYATAHAGELSSIRFYLNLDSAGARDNGRDVVLNEWPDLAPLFERWRDEMALGFAVGQSVSAHSDHFPFFMAGVPTGGIQSAERSLAGRGYGHTQYDTLDKVDQTCVREASALAARLALRIASEETWPVPHREGQAVLELLKGPDYLEEQAYRARIEAFYKRVRQGAG